MMLKLFGGWVVVTAAIAISIRLIWPDDPAPTVKANAPDTSVKGTSGDADVVALHKAMPKCGETLGGFLCASVPEERTQFVHNPVAIAGRVARFYSLNPLTRLDPAGLKPGGQSLLKVPGEQAVEARWTSDDGRLLDCVFIFQDDEWRLDWNHFARYSDYPISLFLAGDGEPEGEFRLLVRERLVKERSENSPMSLVFYEPRFGRPQSEGQATPEFIVPRDSEAARMLTAGFKALADHKAAFGSTLPPIDPEGMIRVRVRIRRLAEPNQTGQKFIISRVVACHWLSSDDPGVKP